MKLLKPQRDARMLRKAAQKAEQNTPLTSTSDIFAPERDFQRSCWALNLVQGGARYNNTELTDRYVDVMLDGQTITSALPWDDTGDTPAAHEIRVLLLCFAAALAATGDL